MSDDLYSKLLAGSKGGRVFRRKRKHQGATWTPDSESALSGDGVWCASCRQRHGYMSRLLGTAYEKINGVWYIRWICLKTGNELERRGLT